MILTILLLFLASCAVLIFAGTLLVRSLSGMASFLRMEEFVVSFVIMAFSTSIPEIMVGIMSALYKNNALALGTVIGSNLADVTLIIGIAILLGRGIRIKKGVLRKDLGWMVCLAILPMALMVIGHEISRTDGAILIGTYAFYLYKLISRQNPSKARMKNKVTRLESMGYTFGFIASLVLLFKSADYVVFYGSQLASELFMPPLLIGLFFVALGTSLPELAFESRAVQQGHVAMALGDVIGSVVANSTIVLGISALIHPITANYNLFLISAAFMLFSVFLFATLLESGWGLSTREGVSLILLYILFVVVELTLKGVIVSPAI